MVVAILSLDSMPDAMKSNAFCVYCVTPLRAISVCLVMPFPFLWL